MILLKKVGETSNLLRRLAKTTKEKFYYGKEDYSSRKIAASRR